ncbi:thioesterase-like superfamily-domain-containing protein [Echria macrotheca]|uniref:Thioesterase-like superfamily-domain-containing protein n=1 Tax=Echria macrotheca TaxID=438768 RepID=A0AAJ0F6G8_9PEZI|nr:thioesterase-like superfamily-domain-containing protein [Echria macrotheca]
MAKTKLIPFSEATQVTPLGDGFYRVNLSPTFRIGSVPNGGYVAACMVRAASTHMSPKNQPHAMTAHFAFLARTEPGPAIIAVEIVKPGRTLSTVHVTLYQGGGALLDSSPWITGDSRKAIAGYFTMADVTREQGLSISSAHVPIVSPPPPRPDFAALIREGGDEHWTAWVPPPRLVRIDVLANTRVFGPRVPTLPPNMADVWMCLSSGEKFDTAALAFVVDSMPITIESYRTAPKTEFPPDGVFWYPTVVMNMDLKKALPAEGEEWLRLRLQTKQIRNGRLDLEVLVYDAQGDLVMLANHVNLILGFERNTPKKNHL